MKKVVKLSVFKNERAAKEARNIRSRLGHSIGTIKSHLGADLAGYGMVAWDREGKTVSSIVMRACSPIAKSLLPTFVKDKLEQHLTEDFTIDSLTAPEPDGAS